MDTLEYSPWQMKLEYEKLHFHIDIYKNMELHGIAKSILDIGHKEESCISPLKCFAILLRICFTLQWSNLNALLEPVGKKILK